MIKKEKILFSIIIPTFNRANMISRAMDSVLAQTYFKWELIIVNDGSIDNTEEVVKKYQLKDNRIKYYFQENKGRSAARNLGIDHSSGEYICFLDDDDYYFEDFLFEYENKLRSLNFPICVVFCRQIEKVNNDLIKHDKFRYRYQNSLIKMYLRYPNVQSLCTSRKIFEEIKFDERFSIGEDLHLFLRIFLSFPSYYIDKYLCVNVVHDKGTMYNELKEELFNNYPYNRLDVLDDLYKDYYHHMAGKKVITDFYNIYNKIAYFYSSTSMKKYKFKKSILFFQKMKFRIDQLQVLYYYTSILLRTPVYFILNLFK